ncbi:MAG: hypothetical protein R3F60_21285 [bacterium]
MDEFPDPYRSVRVRVWNTKTDDGRRTNVGGDEAAAAIELLNIALDQCKPGHPIALAYQSVGTLRLPAQCFVAKLNAIGGLFPNDRFIDCTCGRFLFGDGCGIAGESTYDFIGEIGERINGVPLAERDGRVGVDEPGSSTWSSCPKSNGILSGLHTPCLATTGDERSCSVRGRFG